MQTNIAHLFTSDTDGALYDTRRANWSASPLRAVYARTHREINSGAEFRATLRAGRWAFPGGYEISLITDDGGVLCMECARKHVRSVTDSIRHRSRDGWRVIGAQCAAEFDGTCYCDQCGENVGNDDIDGAESV